MDKLIEAFASAFQLDAETISTLKDENGEWLPESDLAPKIQTVAKDRIGKYGQEKVNEGIRRQAQTFEKWMKGKGFDNADALKGEALWTAFAEHIEGSVEPQPGELTAETAKKHPIVKQLVADELKAARDANEAQKREFEAYKGQVEREKTQEVVRREALAALESNKIRLSVDGTDKTARQEAILMMLQNEKVGIDPETKKPVLLNDDGEPKRDEWGKPFDFAKHVASIGEKMFGKDDFDPSKGSPSPKNEGQGQGLKLTFVNQAAFDAWLSSETDGAKRMQAQNAWLEQQAKQTQ